jgi:formate hydrogenlyase subunit 6/NADH:ubiquinone oxidoreductase subunit I
MGIDVRAFAERELALSNKTTECIFCGICVTVCPVDVLRVEHRGRPQIARSKDT